MYEGTQQSRLEKDKIEIKKTAINSGFKLVTNARLLRCIVYLQCSLPFKVTNHHASNKEGETLLRFQSVSRFIFTLRQTLFKSL